MSKPILPIRFGRIHKHLLYTVFGMLWVSGLLWLVFHYFLRINSEFGEVAHPLEPWWLRLHGLMGFAALVALGSVLPVHVQRGWQLQKNRYTGLAIKLFFLWLAVTGYALYYFLSDANEVWLPWMHWQAGALMPLILVVHIAYGRARPHPSLAKVRRHPPRSAGLYLKQRR